MVEPPPVNIFGTCIKVFVITAYFCNTHGRIFCVYRTVIHGKKFNRFQLRF